MDSGKLRALTNFVNAIGIGPCIESLRQLHDGLHFMEMLNTLKGLKPRQDCDHPIQRYRQILNFLEDVYGAELKFHVDCSQIVNTADETELAKVAVLMLCASVQADEDKAKLFVEPITRLDLTSQTEIKDIIEFVLIMDGSTNQLRQNFADVLHRRVSSVSGVFSPALQSGHYRFNVRGESVSSVSSYDTSIPKTPGDAPASPFQRVYQASPLSPVKALLASPHIANKISLRKMHQKIRQLESRNASERALRDDLEAELNEKNKAIIELESQLRDTNNRLKGTKELQDKVDELQAKQEEYNSDMVQLQKLKAKLAELSSVKEEHSRLSKEVKDFEEERTKLHSTVGKYERLKGDHQEVQKELRQANREIAELKASVQRLSEDLTIAENRCSEAGTMLNQSSQIFKEKILHLEEELTASTAADHLGESLGIITEKRISDLEVELSDLRSTWVEPKVHQALKDRLALMQQNHNNSEDKIKSLEALLDQERWASNEKLSALRAEASSIREESERVSKRLQSKLEGAQHLTISLRADLEKAKDDLSQERKEAADKLRTIETEKETLLKSLEAERKMVQSLEECHRRESDSWEKTQQDLRDSLEKLKEVHSRERITSQEKITSLENEMSTLDVKLKEAHSDKERLETSLETQREEFLKEKDNIQRDLNEKLSDLERESREALLRSQMETTTVKEESIRQMEEAKMEIDKQKVYLVQSHQNEVNGLEDARDELRIKLMHLEETRRLEKEAMERQNAELESKYSALVMNLEAAQKTNDALEASLVSGKQEMIAEQGRLAKEFEAREDGLRKELEALKGSLDKATSESAVQIQRLEQEKMELREEGERMMKGLNDAHLAEIAQLQEINREQMLKMEEQMLASKQDREKSEQTCQELEEKVRVLDADLDKERSERTALGAMLAEMKDEMKKDSDVQILKKDETILKLEGELSTARDELQKATLQHQAKLSEMMANIANTENASSVLIAERQQMYDAELEKLKNTKTKTEEKLQERVSASTKKISELTENLTEAMRIAKENGENLEIAVAEKMDMESRLLQEKAALEEKLVKLESKSETLLEESASTSAKQVRELTQNLKAETARADKMKQKLEEAIKENVEVKTNSFEEKRAMEQRLTELTFESDRMLQEIKSASAQKAEELTNNLTSLAEENLKKIAQVTAEKEEMESRLAGEKDEIKKKMASLEVAMIEERKSSEDEVRKLKGENEDLKFQVGNLEKMQDAYLKSSQMAADEIGDNLQKAITEKVEMETKLLGEKNTMQQKILELEAQVEEERKNAGERRKLVDENQDLRLQVENFKRTQELHQKNSQVAEENLSKTMIEKKAIEEKMLELDRQIDEERKSLQSEGAKLKSENEGLRLQVDNLKRTEELSQKSSQGAEERVRNLNKTVAEKTEIEMGLLKEKKAMEVKMAELKQQIKESRISLESERMILKSENEDLKLELDNLKKEQQSLQRSSQLARETELNKRQSSHAKEVDSLKAEKQQLQEQVQEKKAMEVKMAELKQQIEESRISLESERMILKSENEDLKLEVDNLKKEQESLQRSSQLERETELNERQSSHTKEVENLKAEKQQLLERMNKLMEMNRRYKEGEKRVAEAKDEAMKEYKRKVEAEFEDMKQRYDEEIDKITMAGEDRETVLEKELDAVNNELEHTKLLLSMKTEELTEKAELVATAAESLRSSKLESDKEITTLRESLEKERKVSNRQVDKLKTELLSVKTETCSLQRQIEEEARKEKEKAEEKMAAERAELQARIQELVKENGALQFQVTTLRKKIGPIKKLESYNSSLEVNLSGEPTPMRDRRPASEVFSDSLSEERQSDISADDSLTGTPSQKLGRNLSNLRLDDLSTSPRLTSSQGSNTSLRSSNTSTRSKGRTTIEITMTSSTSEAEPTKCLAASQLQMSQSTTSSQLGLPETVTKAINEVSYNLRSSSTSSQLDLPDRVTQTLDELCASQSSLVSSTPQTKSHHTTGRANFVIVNDCDEEPEFFAWEDRIQELHRRNTLCLPQMRTSYPVETQACAPDRFSDDDLKTKETTFSSGSTTTTVVSSKRASRKRKTDLTQIEEAPVDTKLRKATSHSTIQSRDNVTTRNLRKAVSQEMPPPTTVPHTSKSTAHSSKPASALVVNNSSSAGRVLRSSDIKSVGKTKPTQPLKPDQKALAFNIGFSPKPSIRRRSMRHSLAKRALGKNSPKVNPESEKENGREESERLPSTSTKKSKRRSLGKWLGK